MKLRFLICDEVEDDIDISENLYWFEEEHKRFLGDLAPKWLEIWWGEALIFSTKDLIKFSSKDHTE